MRVLPLQHPFEGRPNAKLFAKPIHERLVSGCAGCSSRTVGTSRKTTRYGGFFGATSGAGLGFARAEEVEEGKNDDQEERGAAYCSADDNALVGGTGGTGRSCRVGSVGETK